MNRTRGEIRYLMVTSMSPRQISRMKPENNIGLSSLTTSYNWPPKLTILMEGAVGFATISFCTRSGQPSPRRFWNRNLNKRTNLVSRTTFPLQQVRQCSRLWAHKTKAKTALLKWSSKTRMKCQKKTRYHLPRRGFSFTTRASSYLTINTWNSGRRSSE